MPTKILKFKINFITGEYDWENVEGEIDDNKRVIDLYQKRDDSYEWIGFIPFTAIKKLEIIKQKDIEEVPKEQEDFFTENI